MRYPIDQITAWRTEAQETVAKLQEALHCAATAERYGLEDYLVDAACMALELSDKLFDHVHEFCPLCEGNDVLVDGKPSDCPACYGERSVTHGRADLIRAELKVGVLEAIEGEVDIHSVQRLGTVNGRVL